MMRSTISPNQKKRLPKPITVTFVAVFWILVWQIVYYIVGSDIIVASPISTFKRVIELGSTAYFWACTLNSILHILCGFLLALIVSIVLAALCSKSKLLYTLFSPIIKLIKATPVASFIVLALFWLSSGVSSFIAFLMVMPLIFTNLVEGFKNVDPSLLEMAKVYRFSRLKKIRLIYIPSIMPYFVSACSVGLGFAWKSGIAAEVIGLPKTSLGLEIYNAKIYLETVDIFALTAVIIILSVIMEKGFMFLLKKLSNRILKGGGKS